MRRYVFASLLGFALLTSGLSARRSTTSPDILPLQKTETTLANGLKVIVVPTGFPEIVSIQIPVQAGSRNEVEPGKTGFAHFFEHLMFRGTPTHPPEKYREIMVRAGARENASTGDDFTRYFVTFAKEDLDTMLRLYADMFQNLSYSEADFKTEARAVLGEYNKNSANPIQKLLEVQRDRAFTSHPYKHRTMGFIQDIENMPNQYAYSKEYFARWYRPEYTTLIVAGDVDAKNVLPIVEKYWGDWKGGHTSVEIPKEPPPRGPLYAHVPWATQTLPFVTVAFHGPAFSEKDKDYAAMDTIADLYFGETSDLYKRLVITDQKVDVLEASNPGNVDPGLFTIFARVKKPEDALVVRDEILKTVAAARTVPVDDRKLADAKSHGRFAFARGLDSTERIASTLAVFAPYRRSFDTINTLYRTFDSLTSDDLHRAAQRYFTDAGLVVTTLSSDPLPEGIAKLPALASFTSSDPLPRAIGKLPVLASLISGRAATLDAPTATASLPAVKAASKTNGHPGHDEPEIPVLLQRTPLPQLAIKLVFAIGSAVDPEGREGLAALAGSMIAEAGSQPTTYEQITAALYPMAGSFTAQVDKEMTTFTASIHRDNWERFFDIVLPQLLEPGFRTQDFERLKAMQMNALLQDLRSNNEEELGKERLQTNIFRGTPYGHPVLGTVAGINAITLEDVKRFVRDAYRRRNLMVGINGDAPDILVDELLARLDVLPSGFTSRASIKVTRATGTDVEIIAKDARATAISFGFPIDVTRSHPDYPALSIVKAWLGEHRASNGRLFQRLREVRGMNYGDYAYIEAFPRGMFQFFPDPNIVRQAQIFEVWIRPVVPVNAHMALRLAVHELHSLIQDGLSGEAFENTRNYLMKNVSLMTARQDQQLRYALDSKWYGTGEFTDDMRTRLAKLTLEDVNRAIRQHLSAKDLSIVIITKDAKGLKDQLAADAFSAVAYDGEKPAVLLDEDKVIGAFRLGIDASRIRITPVEEVFAR